jgi:hypothetical protein
MLECHLCDYYSVKKGKKACEFSDHIFVKNPIDMDKYPCEDMTYDSFLLKNENEKDISIVA